ncbi:MAG TPA: hypothetical protein VEC57_08070 [Candidatus Limnocylindrales bacterium]|nr:hypothetical protein [Candidatus Limnocylindrales bacterium]
MTRVMTAAAGSHAMRRLVVAVTILATLAAGDAHAAKILLIGNSFTTGIKPYLISLIRSSGRDATVVVRAADGWTVADHVASAKTLAKINSKAWDAVVVQEQSLGEFHVRYPAARAIDAQIAAVGAQTVFMMTWRDRGAPLVSYDALRGAPGEDVGYVPIAYELDAPIAPVGWVYREQILNDPDVELWGSDGHHSNERGRYLAALSVYCAVFGESPVGLWAPAAFSPAQNESDQRLVEKVALSDPGEWMIRASTLAAKKAAVRTVVAAAGDDATETMTTASITGGSALTLGAGRIAALRFAGVPIAPGATVRSARLEMFPSTGRANSIVIEYAAVASDDAPPLTAEPGALSKLPLGATSIVDAPPAFDGSVYNGSVDLAPLVQEIVDRPGWAEGNALTILVQDAGSASSRLIRAYEGGVSKAPALVVELEP